MKQGFTLVELLVVVLIIGILSSVALPQYTKAVKKAKGTQVVTAASALAKAANMAYLEDGRYQRFYQSYGTLHSSNDDFDIEVPALKINGERWSLYISNNSSSATIHACNNGDCNCSASGVTAHLSYHLSNGKIDSVTCSGSDCSSYFPGSMLSSN